MVLGQLTICKREKTRERCLSDIQVLPQSLIYCIVLVNHSTCGKEINCTEFFAFFIDAHLPSLCSVPIAVASIR